MLQIDVVAKQDIEALVDNGRVVQFFQSVPGANGCYGGFHGRGVAERRIAVAGGKGRRHHAT
ncbi:hypothetical protein D3C83_167350 [compost metagenome]